MYYNKTREDIEKELNTNIDGLTTVVALERNQKYGKNTLPKKKLQQKKLVGKAMKFFKQSKVLI